MVIWLDLVQSSITIIILGNLCQVGVLLVVPAGTFRMISWISSAPQRRCREGATHNFENVMRIPIALHHCWCGRCTQHDTHMAY